MNEIAYVAQVNGTYQGPLILATPNKIVELLVIENAAQIELLGEIKNTTEGDIIIWFGQDELSLEFKEKHPDYEGSIVTLHVAPTTIPDGTSQNKLIVWYSAVFSILKLNLVIELRDLDYEVILETMEA